ncbi:MAG: Sec-independent protein translocase TatB [Microbacteriaceae bacterium]
MFGLSGEKLLFIALIAVVVVGPQRLPYYAAQLAKLVKQARQFARGAQERLREEMGPEYDEVDWKRLDPRQYDPRRIIRDALLDDDEPQSAIKPVSRTTSAAAQRRSAQGAGLAAPYDTEAT